MVTTDNWKSAAQGVGVYDSVADAIGNTPLVKLNSVTDGAAATVYVKLEYLNPGGSVKDRAALAMIRAAEAAGDLRPGGTVVEGTSGNTGVGLAMIAASRGYRTVVVVPDKTSSEKIALLRAHGAEVRVTPGGRPSHHPEFVRNIAARLAQEIPGGWLAGQYDNPANPAAHRTSTGPEIWNQTSGRISHFVAGIGTGGTVTGAGGYLKEVSGGTVTVIGADPQHSVYGGGDGRAWHVEAVGHFLHPDTEKDDWPDSYHTDIVDQIEQITDLEAIVTLHRLAREEGLLLGGSSGIAVAAGLRAARILGAEDVVVVIAPDSGRAYLSKYFDDDWLGPLGFPLYRSAPGPVVRDTLQNRYDLFRYVPASASVAVARELIGNGELLPVALQRSVRGSVPVTEILGIVTVDGLREAGDAELAVSHLAPSLPTVGLTEPTFAAALRLTGHIGYVVVADAGAAVGLAHISDIS
ncbi:PLP-dependent cysteine synthase family protein [Rhodococcus sp. NPDC056516]|uniref:PLP-dependent cysteine synthase family protein n=1 Tax=unclassified Rhodococcus (in: high G+C Gram-positive bacteria) TaxID=192944 RepID=UPI00366E5FE4